MAAEDPAVVIRSIFEQCDEQVKAAKDILEIGGSGPSRLGIAKAQAHATLANYYALRAQVFMTSAASQLATVTALEARGF